MQSLLEGRTDCPISGVFGAGKTRAGLLVMDPTLKIMIVTKENVAAQAFAWHFLWVELPSSVNGLVGRLVGYVELQTGPANKTDLDVPPAFRNDVLRMKPLLSLVCPEDALLSGVAGLPKETFEAIALRGNTDYLQPHMLGSVVVRYLEGTDGSPVDDIWMLLAEGLSSDPKLTGASLSTLKMLSQEVVGVFFERFHAPVLRAALAVLWLSLHREKFPLLADWLITCAVLQVLLGSSGGP